MTTTTEPTLTPTIDRMQRDGSWNPLWNTLSQWGEQFMAMYSASTASRLPRPS
ncbi:hypothetical protein [Prescottella soli]|uniref:Uncharacterized protein n=1 Tax=Prescottella soli TaxID=1543852 RepID=A0ABW9FPJ4_9NOCA